jgi:hypothetical protein
LKKKEKTIYIRRIIEINFDKNKSNFIVDLKRVFLLLLALSLTLSILGLLGLY